VSFTKEHNDKGFEYKVRSLYGRRQGRALTQERLDVIENLLPELEIKLNDLPLDQSVNPQSYFQKTMQKFWLEIGFGQGEHVSALMRDNPDTGYLAAEPFVNGMAAFLKDIQEDPNDNIRVLKDDGMLIAKSLKQETLDGIYILNPDPWHKARHHKRRIINQNNLDVFSKILKPQGKLVVTTDVEPLTDWIIAHLMQRKDFKWTARSHTDWNAAPDGWISTRYETKGAKGAKKMNYMIFEKIA